MRVAVDARPAAFPQPTGVGTYTRQLLRWLPRVAPEDTFLAWHLDARRWTGQPALLPAELAEVRTRPWPIPSRWFEIASERWDLPRLEWMARFDVLFAPNFVPPPTRSDRVVVTVHDLAFRRFPETAPQSTRRWLARLDRALARAGRILAVSAATKADLVELAGVDPARIVVTPLGVDPDVYRPAPPEEVDRVRRAFGLAGPYVLSVGGIEPRKNLPRLVEAFGRLPADVDATLVIAGGGVAWNPEGRQGLEAAIRRLPPDRAGRIRRTGYLSERDKVALLTGAEVMASPSLYEGFGLPVLEAMACGAPVLTANRSSLPEVAGDAARLVDPEDTDAVEDALRALLADEAERDRRRTAGLARAAGYRWEETARRTVAVLREVAARRRG